MNESRKNTKHASAMKKQKEQVDASIEKATIERGIAVSIEDVKAVLKELHDEDKIMVDGDDFYNVS